MNLVATAQKQHRPPASQQSHRCGTMELLNQMIREDPSIVDRWREEGQKQYRAYLQRKEEQSGLRIQPGDIVIPVVFHLVGSASVVNAIPDRDVYEQLEIMNRDFAGEKAGFYKANGVFAPEFIPAIANIPVRFVLARRTPAGTAANGIERRITTRTFTQTTINELKSTTLGGLDPWDVSKYLNIWCATFSDNLLGIATFPFTNSTTIGPQGVAIHLLTLGANPCRNYSPLYNEGATLSHEVGHYLYLWHTFGDNAACNNLDFRIQSGWPLTEAASNDDTPPEKAVEETMYGNVSGLYSDGCAPTPPGMMYMNFMNYFDDRSLFFFTNGQKERVIATLDMYRASLKTSDGFTPPAPVTDAYLLAITPMGKCDSRSPVLDNTPIKATVRNYGTTTLTSVSLSVQIDGGAPVTATFPINLEPLRDTTLDAGAITGARGNHTVVVYATAPNGATDDYLHNDTITSRVSIRTNFLTAPFTEDFEGPFFPPRLTAANDLWYVNNPTGTNTWMISDLNFFTSGAVAAANYSYNEVGQLDDLITPPIDFGTSDSSVLSFRVAHARYDDPSYTWDGLEVHASNDGGQNWFIIYKKTGKDLETQTDTEDGDFDPEDNDDLWRTENVNLTPFIVAGQKLIFKFRNINAWGNNIFIDDIAVSAAVLPTRDATVLAIKGVPPFQCDDFSIEPIITIGNKAKGNLTTLNINYRIDNNPVTTIAWTGNLAKGAVTDFALGTLSNIPAGAHMLTVYTSDPNNGADEDVSNDTLHFRFTIFTPTDAPITQGFETGTFPPAGWGLVSSGINYTWERNTLSSTEQSASAWVRNYQSGAGQTDNLFSPVVRIQTVDSVYVRFDVAHATKVYPGSTGLPMDTLEVLITADCGLTFTSVYKKWGAELQTLGDPNTAPVYDHNTDPIGFVPISHFWRKEHIDISRAVAGKSSFQVVFKNTSNGGNNTFLDNINIFTVTLPAQLKSEGYIIYPNPFSDAFEVRHLIPPANLKGMVVISSSGQVVYQRSYNGNAGTNIRVDLSRFSNGVYTLRMFYDDKVVTQRIIKRPH